MVGKHVLVDFYDCSRVVEVETQCEFIMVQAAKMAGSTVRKVVSTQFEPGGVSVVVLLAESHMSLHTWPERNYAAVDLFTCGVKMVAQPAIDYLKHYLGAQSVEIIDVERGSKIA